MDNLWHLPPKQAEEDIALLVHNPHVRIERIVSYGHASPAGFFYDQDWMEWVSVLEGEAILEYEDGTKHSLSRGDSVILDAHQRHRVAYTSDPCIWLCVFYEQQGQ